MKKRLTGGVWFTAARPISRAKRSGGGYTLNGDGLIELSRERVRGISHLGGTIIGSTNKGNPTAYPVQQGDGGIGQVSGAGEIIQPEGTVLPDTPEMIVEGESKPL